MKLLTRAPQGAIQGRDYDQPCILCTTVKPSYSDTSQAQKLAAIEKAALAGCDYVRLTAELYGIAPNRATRTYTYLDDNIDAAVDNGLGVLLGMTEGVENGDWNCTNRKSYLNFSSTDRPYWEALMYDIVERCLARGLSKSQLAVTLLNECDNTNFGASVNGQLTTMHMNVLDWMGTFLRANFPWLVLVGPSLFYNDSSALTWPVITDAYFTAGGRLRPVWQDGVLDYFDWHIYPNQDVRVPPPGPNEVFHCTRALIDNGYTQLAALTGGSRFANMRYLSSETNNTYTSIGCNTTRWVYGSEETLEIGFDAQIDALMLDERCHACSVYYIQNNNALYDGRSNATHHGLYRYDGTTTKRLGRFAKKSDRQFDPAAVTATNI